jgi:gentisate 1,2-dioxygenase
VRYTNPTTGGDVMPTIRAEFHRFRAGAHTRTRRDVGSAVYQVFEGAGQVQVGNQKHTVGKGDLIVVPSWVEWSIEADTEFDLFMFSDAPIVERLHFNRTFITEGA